MSLQALLPQFEENTVFGRLGFASSAWFVSGRLPLARGTVLVAELPLAYGSMESQPGDAETSLVLGNPYVGAVVQPWSLPVTAELGVRIPLAADLSGDDFATGIGILADTDRAESFVRERASVVGMLNYKHPFARSVALHLRGGAMGLLSTSNELYEDAGDVVLGYGALAWYELVWGAVGGGLTGRWGVTDEERVFRDEAVHQLGLTALFTRGQFQPSVQMRVPLNGDLSEVLRFIVGVGLRVNLSSPRR
ncbi:MAG TPA: hypothetical protein VHG28_09425 [Longimicrobiaceae bacterium]|nr:hypothetical protein [Longimicrobiaceae bacterium]